MPALNIEFTDAELARLRERARTEGVSMRTLAHDTIISCATAADKDDMIMAEVARVIQLSRGLLDRLADL